MDFQKLKEKAQKLKEQAIKSSKDAVDFGAKKLSESSLTLKTIKELEDFALSSKNTSHTLEDGTKKEYKKRVVVVFAQTNSDFFEKMLYMLPVLVTKAFSQNISFKLADVSMKDLEKSSYGITDSPALVVFENTKVLKTITGEESIQKVVKAASLDINATIDSI